MADTLLSPETEARVAKSRLRWYRTIGVVAIITCLGTLYGLALLLDGAGTARDQRSAQLAQGAQTKALARLLVECTTAPQFREPAEDPEKVAGSDCYARQQAATADFVGEPSGPINSVTVIAAACGASHPGDIPGTRACVERGLRARK